MIVIRSTLVGPSRIHFSVAPVHLKCGGALLNEPNGVVLSDLARVHGCCQPLRSQGTA